MTLGSPPRKVLLSILQSLSPFIPVTAEESPFYPSISQMKKLRYREVE